MKQSNSRWAVNLTALVLAAGLLIGLLTGCPHNQPPAKPVDPAAIFSTDGSGTITDCKCAKEELPALLVIPAKIGNEEIKEIGSDAFKDCTGLRSVDLLASLTKIESGAFSGCTDLRIITLPASLTEIGSGAFYKCTGLTSVHLPANLTTIDEEAFYNCTGLRSVHLPASLTTIASNAFFGCTGLTRLTIDSANTAYKTEGNILYNKAGTTLIWAAGGLTSANILNTVTTIGEFAFLGCTGLTSIRLPASLTKIDQEAFYGCTGLKSISLPAKLAQIGGGAFRGCTGLTSVDFANKNGWKVYNNGSYSGTSTSISSSDLANASKAAEYLRKSTYNGGYCNKYWKKN